MVGNRRGALRVAVVVLCLAAVAGACSSGGGKVASGPDTTIAAGGPGTTAPNAPKAAARWETVVTLDGAAGASSPSVDILPGAIQWRARYDCAGGALKVETTPPPRRNTPLIDTACPATGEGYSIVTGSVKLAIAATGAWKLIVDQQVDTPLDEPPLPAMASARVLGQGAFYNVEKNGEGTARLYRLPDGGHALRLENLKVNENTDLFVWLDEARAPKTSEDAAAAQYWVIGNLKSTIGNQNYTIPANVPIDRVNSIVIWCQPVAIAYAAAALTR